MFTILRFRVQWDFPYEGHEKADMTYHLENLNSLEKFMYLTGSEISVSTCFVFCLTHIPISQLPLPLMSLIKDLFPCVSLWSFLRSQLLHPWNWRLEWILSPLISFIPVLSRPLYCSVLTFSLGGIHGKVVSFFQWNYVSCNISTNWSLTSNLIPNRRSLSVLCLDPIPIPDSIYSNYHTFPLCVTETCYDRSVWTVSIM